MKIALCQINLRVGALSYNLEKIKDFWQQSSKADIAVFPELSITGYPPEDLIENKWFLSECEAVLSDLLEFSKKTDTAAIIGLPKAVDNKIYNAAVLIHKGAILNTVYKTMLPNYGVFDEKRNFSWADNNNVVTFKGKKIGILICEDAWSLDIAKKLVSRGSEILISINASPFNADKHSARYAVSHNITSSFEVPYIYVNSIGAQDELVFDGGSFALDAKSEYMLSPNFWEESLYMVDIDSSSSVHYEEEELEASIYNAIVIGIRDYILKNGFSKCIIGLSGGIDSALVAAIAVDALGSANVKGYMLPSRFTSDHSTSDAVDLAARLGIEIQDLSIEHVLQSSEKTLEPLFKGLESDITEENLQSRIRGLLLMALSNKFGSLLLSTGNKSEYAVGYATIYGDMCGAYAPIKDVYKTDVYKLATWRNKNIPKNSMHKTLEVIPHNSIKKEPSAELRDGQKDQDTLPDYDILDRILYGLIELDKMPQELAQDGFDFDLSSKVYNMLIRSEYKRNQSATGPKVSRRSLGKDRRYPITNCYRIKYD